MQRRRRGFEIGLLYLALNIYRFGLDNIPPVTMAVLGLNVFLFVMPLKPLMKCCISVNCAYHEGDWQRLVLSSFHHVDDWHLYFNMASLIWKGAKLERRLGRVLFALIIVAFSLLTNVVYLLLQFLLAEITNDQFYLMQCAVGFSGVLFALKVLINHYYPGWSTIIFDVQVPNKYACWAELVIIHILVPESSFVGHLSGILVGLLYTHGPLEKILKKAVPYFSYTGRPARQQNYNYYGYARQPEQQSQGNGAPGTDDTYTGGLDEVEQLQEAIRLSLNNPAPVAPQEDTSLEELRRRRVNKFAHSQKPKKPSVLGKEFNKLDYR